MNVSRGAHNAINSWASTGRSPAFLLPKRGFGGAVFQEVAGHPVVFAAAGEIFHRFTPIAAMQFRAAFAGGAHQHQGEALIVRHGHQSRLAVARHTFDSDMFRIDGLVGLEIIEATARAPGPGAQGCPSHRACAAGLCWSGR